MAGQSECHSREALEDSSATDDKFPDPLPQIRMTFLSSWISNPQSQSLFCTCIGNIQGTRMTLFQTAYDFARVSRYRLKEKFGDWRYGIHSADFFMPTDIAVKSPECHPYGAIGYNQFNEVLNALDIRAGTDVFLDYGCGMGRPIVMAATRPFRRVIGVELSQDSLKQRGRT